MCAIIGWAGRISPAILRKAVRNSWPSGPHAAGFAHTGGSVYGNNPRDVKANGLSIFKRAIHPEFVLRNNNHRVDECGRARLGLFHVRWATHGARDEDKNAHPFLHHAVDAQGTRYDIVYCHNGVIGNWRTYASQHAVVDSECFGPLLATREPGKADGSTGLVWFEAQSGDPVHPNPRVFCYRHSQGLHAFTYTPLYREPFTIVVSRPTQLTGIAELANVRRHETPLVEGYAYEIKPWGLTEVWQTVGGLQRAPSRFAGVDGATFRG